jgi:hypothetical protein
MFDVLLERKRSAYRHIEVIAENSEEAERKALALVADDPGAFSFDDNVGDENATVMETDDISEQRVAELADHAAELAETEK